MIDYQSYMNSVANEPTMVAYFERVDRFLAWFMETAVHDRVFAAYSFDALEARQALTKYLRRARKGIVTWEDWQNLTWKADTFYTDMTTFHDEIGNYALDKFAEHEHGNL
jgi:hypothetical protein